MSEANRKRMFDELIAKGREADICQSLKDEFAMPEEVPPETKKVKKKWLRKS